MLQFLKDMVAAFNVGPNKTHIAVVTYGTSARVEIHDGKSILSTY